jgi:DnaJ-class molecular chaperone
MKFETNYYELLEVRENASSEVISMAYKALARKYHPDIFKGDNNFATGMMQN